QGQRASRIVKGGDMAQQTRSRTQRAASTAKRTAAKKALAKRAPAKKAPAKKTVAKKAPAKRAPARKAPAKKTTTRAAAKTTQRPLTAKGRVSRNETPNTPDLYESELGRMRVVELRDMARAHNIPGQSTMRKHELVTALLRSGIKKPTGRAAKKA